MGQSSPKLVTWAAQDGRVQDLVYHINTCGPNGLKPAPGSEKKRAPLHFAAIGGYIECISILYDAGANLNVKDEDGMTPLHHAAANGHFYAAQLLLDLGANEKLSTRFGIAPIHLATSCGHTSLMKVLASHGADIDQQESWGQTPLMISTQQSRLECMKLLLSMGANRECCDRIHGNTALHIACTTKDEETLLLLLDGGCNVVAVNTAGLTPLGVAIDSKFYRGVPLLMEYGAKPNQADFKLCSSGLQEYLVKSMNNVKPLVSMCRIALRQYLGPSNLTNEDLESLKLGEELVKFVSSVRDDCCATDEAKTHALRGRTIITNSEAPAMTKF